jgi:hypothetical protein
MKKQKLTSKHCQHGDFSIFSISTTLVDYTLAFYLNTQLNLNLTRRADIPVYLNEESASPFSLFLFIDDDQSEYHLIQDTSRQTQMMNQFLLFIRGQQTAQGLSEIEKSIRQIEDIFEVNQIVLQENPKGKEAKTHRFINNLITDLEYHKLDMSKNEEEGKIKLKPTQQKTVRKLYNQ